MNKICRYTQQLSYRRALEEEGCKFPPLRSFLQRPALLRSRRRDLDYRLDRQRKCLPSSADGISLAKSRSRLHCCRGAALRAWRLEWRQRCPWWVLTMSCMGILGVRVDLVVFAILTINKVYICLPHFDHQFDRYHSIHCWP